jgi:N-acetylglucosaminyldiphosphoundecaprenol N-acetyl-beta-D-mannosaminyltransferase
VNSRGVSEGVLSRLRVAPDEASVDALLQDLRQVKSVSVVSFVNSHSINIAHSNTEFLTALLESDLLLRDGIGLKIACWIYRRAPGLNLNGTDLIPRIIAAFADSRVMLCGAKENALQRAAARLRQDGVSDLVAVNGYESSECYLRAVERARPALIVLGMGTPRQELLARELKSVCAASAIPCAIVNGGAIIDFLGGTVRRAPAWTRRLGLEWFFRLCQEPRRLAARYILGIPIFFASVLTDLILTFGAAEDLPCDPRSRASSSAVAPHEWPTAELTASRFPRGPESRPRDPE